MTKRYTVFDTFGSWDREFRTASAAHKAAKHMSKLHPRGRFLVIKDHHLTLAAYEKGVVVPRSREREWSAESAIYRRNERRFGGGKRRASGDPSRNRLARKHKASKSAGKTVYVVFEPARNKPYLVGLFKTKSEAARRAARAKGIYGTSFTARALTQSMVEHLGPAEWRKLMKNPRYRASASQAYKAMRKRHRSEPNPFYSWVD